MDDEPLDNKEMLNSTDNFETAYESHAPAIYRFLYWRTKDVHLSEDLTSSVFEKAWQSRSNFHGGSEQAWLHRIARNVLIDHWRKNKEFATEDIDTIVDDALATGELLDKNYELTRLRRAVNKLPSDMQLVIVLRFIHGLSSKQTAKKLHLGESNVRVIQYRALKKLKEYLR